MRERGMYLHVIQNNHGMAGISRMALRILLQYCSNAGRALHWKLPLHERVLLHGSFSNPSNVLPKGKELEYLSTHHDISNQYIRTYCMLDDQSSI